MAQRVTAADLPPAWRILYEERAAIIEFDAGRPRDQAEAAALTDVERIMREEREAG